MPPGVRFPSHKPSYMLKLLKKKLHYVEVKDSGPGSHTWLEAKDRPRIRWAYHNRQSMAPREVRKLLVEQAGLTLDEAKEVLGIG